MRYLGEDYLLALEKAKNYNAFIIAWILRFLRTEDSQIIDFGAGTGLLARLLEKQAGKHVQCLEPAENMKLHLPPDTLDSLDHVADESVDFIYSSNVLEHIEDDAGIVREMGRALRPGGRVFLYLPAFQCLFSALDRKVGHFRRYDKTMLRRLFSEKTWKILSLRYADCLGLPGLFGSRRLAMHVPPIRCHRCCSMTDCCFP